MLKGIHPALSPELLFHLASMGHGDEIVIADANFPASSTGQRVVFATGSNATTMLDAILSLVPLDQYQDRPAAVMAVVGDPTTRPEIYGGFARILDSASENPVDLEKVERFDFYERARKAYCIVATGEGRLYGNIILAKGVIAPNGNS